MGSPLPPDPYLALGVPKDASAAVIKSQYRKLVLKFHPDKVQDEAQKQVAADQFHRIQTAWEIIGDEDKRQRYDAQCKLAELRKDVMERQGGGGRGVPEVRTAAYKVPTEAPRAASMYARGPERTDRVSPTYEERKPAGYPQPAYASDYFDSANRSSARKDPEYERAPKRASPRDERETKKATAKESKSSEKTRRRESERANQRDIRRDRDRKTAYVVDEPESSDPDEYERQPRRGREDRDDLEQLRRARDAYHEQAKRDKMDAQRGYYDAEDRAKKLYSQYDAAREHIESKARSSKLREDPERRPSPVRMSSSRDKVEYLKRTDGRPVAVRRGSGRPKAASPKPEERRRRSSADYDDDLRRPPPPLHQSKSSPADIKIPLERERAQSVQLEHPIKDDLPMKMKRSETMPNVPSATRENEPTSRSRRHNAPAKASGLRQTEMAEGLPTPGATPDYTGPAANKYRYNQEYADDHEYPTPDGYQTQVREPAATSKARYTRSPSPMREREREPEPLKRRATSSRYATTTERPAPLPRTTSTSYVYNPSQGGVESYGRPSMTREHSSARSALYGEIPTTRDARSPRQTASRYSPPESPAVRYQRDIRPEDVRMQSGYSSRRASEARPSYSRSGSGNPIHVR